eukprot:5435570-Alexandrium_andersonii.AAC.1
MRSHPASAKDRNPCLATHRAKRLKESLSPLARPVLPSFWQPLLALNTLAEPPRVHTQTP